MSQSAGPPQKSWFGRNWLWFVPLVIVAPLLCCCGGGAAMIFGVFNAVKSTDVYKESVETAKMNPEVKALLGEPIEPSSLVVGAVTVQNGIGTAELMVPLTGPKGSGNLVASARKQNNGPWQYSKLEVMAPGGRIIDLRGQMQK